MEQRHKNFLFHNYVWVPSMPDYWLFVKKNPREKVTGLFGEQSLRAVIYASQILAQLSSRKRYGGE